MLVPVCTEVLGAMMLVPVERMTVVPTVRDPPWTWESSSVWSERMVCVLRARRLVVFFMLVIGAAPPEA